MSEKKPLAQWKTWRGEISVNRHIRAGFALQWEGKLWCGSEADRKTLEELIREDRLLDQAPPG